MNTERLRIPGREPTAQALVQLFQSKEGERKGLVRPVRVPGGLFTVCVRPLAGRWGFSGDQFPAHALLRADPVDGKFLLVASTVVTDRSGFPIDEIAEVGRATVPEVLTGVERDTDVITDATGSVGVIHDTLYELARRPSTGDPNRNTSAMNHLRKMLAHGTSFGAQEITDAITYLVNR